MLYLVFSVCTQTLYRTGIGMNLHLVKGIAMYLVKMTSPQMPNSFLMFPHSGIFQMYWFKNYICELDADSFE